MAGGKLKRGVEPYKNERPTSMPANAKAPENAADADADAHVQNFDGPLAESSQRVQRPQTPPVTDVIYATDGRLSPDQYVAYAKNSGREKDVFYATDGHEGQEMGGS
jgi:hypothetical protein